MTTIYIVENDDIKQCWVGSTHSFHKGESVVNNNCSYEITDIIHTNTATYLYVELEGLIILPDICGYNALLGGLNV